MTGFILHYSLLFALFGSALIVFIFLSLKGRLGIDEEAKYQLFEDDDE
ncbi:MAG: hypothetical protein S4CHLAM81_02000 [Chlamydiales bacterium]|nr:hypothetical protein [Chlamydiales bacterium]MCH9634994.1 hypothetical protein [Chlamydiales bacterium]